MVKVVKFKATENVTPERIRKAIQLLENKGTKKAACEILGIAYNTTRLQKILNEFTEREEREKRLRDEKKGKAITESEAKDIIKEYLESGSVDATSRMFFRTPYMINQVLEHYGAKLHSVKTDYFNPMLLPDICMVSYFEEGEVVWSSRHNTLAIIKKVYEEDVYAIRVLGKYEKDSFQMVEDLGSLRHLEAIGLNLKTLRIYESEIPEDKDG